MKIAFLASLLGVEATGQSAVPAITAARLAAAGEHVTILATDCAVGGGPVEKYVTVPPSVTVRIFPSVGRINRRLFRSPALTAWLREHIDEFDVLDVQGTWSFAGKDAAQVFAAAGKPYVLTPHGMMTSYDWQKSMTRRKLFFQFGFGKVWRQADAIRFLSTGEQANSYHPAVRKAAIVPNFIDLPAPVSPEDKAAARERLGIAPDDRVLLFLGRLTHQKGVKEIVSAFELAAREMPAMRLFLVGPQEGAYGAEVKAQAQASPVHERITLPGPVFGEKKYDYLRAADAFITLSHNEGQSIAHLEAMGHGLPMILTASSNMDDLTEYGAGILTTHDAAKASQAMIEVLSNKDKCSTMSRNAYRLVRERYTPEVVIPQLVDLYHDISHASRR